MEKMMNRPNILLARDDVGRPKPCQTKLPPDGFRYGKPDYKLDEVKGNIITGGYDSMPVAPKTQRNSKPVIDFKKLNRAQAYDRNKSVSAIQLFIVCRLTKKMKNSE